MKSLSELSVKLVVILAFTVVTSVRSEYTWNGSEWVWSETPETKNEEVQSSNYGYEGSGGGGGGYGDDMDDNFDDEYNIEEGSGDNLVEDNFDQNTGNNYNSNSNYNNNYNQGNSYNNNDRNTVGGGNNGFQDPYNPYVNQDLGSRNGGQINNNFDSAPSTKAPYYNSNPENSGGDDIYVDPPVVPATTSTTTPAPRDPSIRPKNPSRPTSFFAQPGTLAAVIGGAVVGLLCAILCVMFVVYRMRKKDEGSYALDEPKRSPTVNAYAKHPSREFYA